MKKMSYSALPLSTMLSIDFTLGTLEQAILFSNRISNAEKEFALRQLQRDTNNAPPNTPLSKILPKLGGGALGALLARSLGGGGLAMGLMSLAGYSLAELVVDFYMKRVPGSNSTMRVVL